MPPLTLLQARLGMRVDVVGVQGTGLQEDGAGLVKTLPIPALGVGCGGSPAVGPRFPHKLTRCSELFCAV